MTDDALITGASGTQKTITVNTVAGVAQIQITDLTAETVTVSAAIPAGQVGSGPLLFGRRNAT